VVLALPYLIVPFYRSVDPVSTPMLWRWATGGRVERTFVPIGRVAPTLPLTVILAEDASFCHNHGIDLSGVREALQQADEDIAEARGGSTITQQTAKNLFLWQGRSFLRKALEIPLALWINLVLPKRRVLEIYLNIVEWGPRGQFGAEAGAQWAFGKSARDLTARDSAEPVPPQRTDAQRHGAPARRGVREPRRELPGARCLHPPPGPPVKPI
jgi:monofunctional biosynthetic peptidoglycan transglycosylase